LAQTNNEIHRSKT
jgi:hypothetical protein